MANNFKVPGTKLMSRFGMSHRQMLRKAAIGYAPQITRLVTQAHKGA